MITFFIVLAVLLVVAIIAALAIMVFGAGAVVLLGDLAVFGLIVWGVIRLFRRRK